MRHDENPYNTFRAARTCQFAEFAKIIVVNNSVSSELAPEYRSFAHTSRIIARTLRRNPQLRLEERRDRPGIVIGE